ncbi:hypothetical protein Stsp01_40120 [Streptomyces sp. NBRC 13847]|nr:hypothetical protein Stsp01_40120 [Streptomyces sp. NBRC 13847]
MTDESGMCAVSETDLKLLAAIAEAAAQLNREMAEVRERAGRLSERLSALADGPCPQESRRAA